MYSERENLMRTIRGQQPDHVVNSFRPFRLVADIPIAHYLRAGKERGKTVTDPWGVTYEWPEEQFSPLPSHKPEHRVITDITRWREQVTVPDLYAQDFDWTAARQSLAEIDRKNHLATVIVGAGLFEQSHYLMGFEDTFIGMMEEEEEMHALLDALFDFKMSHFRLLLEHLDLDCIVSHDDWGTSTALFMHPDTWRKYFRPRYQKLYAYLKAQGVLVVHHSDSHNQAIIEDMADCHIDIWQGVIPQNDIVAMQRQMAGRIAFMGGIGSQVDVPGATEEEIRAEVRRACETYLPGGCFIPCITYGGVRCAMNPGVDDIVEDEIDRCGAGFFRPG